jgi:hypothetical protein
VQSLFTAPLAVLCEGGLAHALHCLVSREPLTSMLTNQPAHEASLRLLATVMSKEPLQPLLLMSAGPPPCLQSRCAGLEPGGCTVAAAVGVLKRSADRFQREGIKLNGVNAEGIHVEIDNALEFVLFVTDTGVRLVDVRPCQVATRVRLQKRYATAVLDVLSSILTQLPVACASGRRTLPAVHPTTVHVPKCWHSAFIATFR